MPISYTALPNSTYPRFHQLPQRRRSPDRRDAGGTFLGQRRPGAGPGERSDGVAEFRLGLAPAAARGPQPERHAVVDLRRRSDEVPVPCWMPCTPTASTRSNEIGANGYVSSVESRTIWVHLDETNFTTLFGPGATLLSGTTPTGQATWYWNGSLSLPDAMVAAGVSGLWFDSGRFDAVLPNPGGGVQAAMPQGPQSLGNSAGSAATEYLSAADRRRLLQLSAVRRLVGSGLRQRRADQGDRAGRAGRGHRVAGGKRQLSGADRPLSRIRRHQHTGQGRSPSPAAAKPTRTISCRPLSIRPANARSMSAS